MGWVDGREWDDDNFQERRDDRRRVPLDSEEEMPQLDLSNLFGGSERQSDRTIPREKEGTISQNLQTFGGFRYKKVG